VSIIYVPYHLDEYLPDLDVPLPAGTEVVTVTADRPDADLWTRLAHLYEPVAAAVAGTTRGAAAAVVVSGDCVVSLATMAGLQRAGVDAAVVWFDAHGDVQTLETTTSGYLGGMPLRILLGYRPELIARRLGLRSIVEDRAVLVDARDLDPAEVDYLATARIRRCGVDDLDANVLPAGPLLLHLDLDVVDGEALPGLRYPVPGGPSIAAVLDAAGQVLATGRVAAVDIACTWYPGRDDPDVSRALLATLVELVS
jgi:arginase